MVPGGECGLTCPCTFSFTFSESNFQRIDELAQNIRTFSMFDLFDLNYYLLRYLI